MDADLVIRGRPEWVEWGAGGGWFITTVRVSERFKGPASDTIRFVQHWSGGREESRRPSGLPADTRETLFFLKDRRRVQLSLPPNVVCEWASEGYSNSGAPIPLEDEPTTGPTVKQAAGRRQPKAIGADLRPLNRRDEILSLTREACAAAPQVPPGSASARPHLAVVQVYIHRREVKWSFLGDLSEIRVPLDARTEARARQWAASSHAFLRYHALQVLCRPQFRSDENIRVMRGMLDDPDYVETGRGPTRARFYILRRLAQQALADWGTSAPDTHLEDALLDYRPAGKAVGAWVSGAAVLAVSAGWLTRWALLRRARGRITGSVGGFVGSLVAVSAAASVALIVLWSRSATHGDEIVFTRGARHRLVSYRGNVQYTFARPWSGGNGLVFGSFPLSKAERSGQGEFDQEANDAWDAAGFGTFWIWEGPWPFPDIFDANRSPAYVWERQGLTLVRGTRCDSTGVPRAFTTLRVPCADLIALTALPAVATGCWLGLGWWRRRRRARRGLCPGCGYDLRASTNRCPECGREVPAGLARMTQRALRREVVRPPLAFGGSGALSKGKEAPPNAKRSAGVSDG